MKYTFNYEKVFELDYYEMNGKTYRRMQIVGDFEKQPPRIGGWAASDRDEVRKIQDRSEENNGKCLVVLIEKETNEVTVSEGGGWLSVYCQFYHIEANQIKLKGKKLTYTMEDDSLTLYQREKIREQAKKEMEEEDRKSNAGQLGQLELL